MATGHTKRTMRRCTALAAVGAAVLTVTGGAFAVSGSAQTSGAAPTTLKIITWNNPPALQAFKTIDAQFQKKYPNVTVQLQTAPSITAGYATLIETAIDARSADIVTTVDQVQPLPLKPTRTSMSSTQYWATSKVFQSLNSQPWIHDFSKSALQTTTYKSNVYGVLSGVYQELVFYNKADFAKYHLSVPHTYSQFIDLLNKEQTDHLTPLWIGLGSGASVYVTRFLAEPLMAELWQPNIGNQKLATALEKGTVSWNTPAFVNVLTEEAAISKYFEPGYTGASWEGMPSAFASNRSPLLMDGTWDLASINKANPTMQIGAFPLPGSNTASRNEPVANTDLTFWVLRNAPDKTAALEWMSFFSSKPIYEEYVNITGISPTETGGTYHSLSSKVLGSLLGTGFNPGDILPTLAVNQGYYDTPTEWPLLQEAVMAGSDTPQQAAKLYAQDWKKS